MGARKRRPCRGAGQGSQGGRVLITLPERPEVCMRYIIIAAVDMRPDPLLGPTGVAEAACGRLRMGVVVRSFAVEEMKQHYWAVATLSSQKVKVCYCSLMCYFLPCTCAVDEKVVGKITERSQEICGKESERPREINAKGAGRCGSVR